MIGDRRRGSPPRHTSCARDSPLRHASCAGAAGGAGEGGSAGRGGSNVCNALLLATPDGIRDVIFEYLEPGPSREAGHGCKRLAGEGWSSSGAAVETGTNAPKSNLVCEAPSSVLLLSGSLRYACQKGPQKSPIKELCYTQRSPIKEPCCTQKSPIKEPCYTQKNPNDMGIRQVRR